MTGGARVRLNAWQQAAVALGSAVGALLDPRRADLIAALGETTRKPAFERVLERMKRSPEGMAILLEQPRVISAKVGHAWDLPENTFGAKFMGSRNFSPDDRPPVRFMETDEVAYVAMRAREVHDFWHTLFDNNVNDKSISLYSSGLLLQYYWFCYMYPFFSHRARKWSRLKLVIKSCEISLKRIFWPSIFLKFLIVTTSQSLAMFRVRRE